MTRNEVRAMLALLIVITAGIGLRSYRDHAQKASFVELERARNSVNARYHPEEHSPPEAYTPQSAVPADPAAADMYGNDGRLNLNLANIVALDALPRIGEARARAILQFRNANGPFSHISQLTEIDGIGEKTLELLRPLVYVEPPESKVSEENAPVPSSSSGMVNPTPNPAPSSIAVPSPMAEETADNTDEKININTAKEEELQALWNIGPAKAKAIVEHRRQHGPFRVINDLQDVSGIGPATIERNRSKITCSD